MLTSFIQFWLFFSLFCRASLFIQFVSVSLSFIGSYRVLLGFTEFSRFLLGFSLMNLVRGRFFKVFDQVNVVLTRFTQFLSFFSRFYWVVLT